MKTIKFILIILTLSSCRTYHAIDCYDYSMFHPKKGNTNYYDNVRIVHSNENEISAKGDTLSEFILGRNEKINTTIKHIENNSSQTKDLTVEKDYNESIYSDNNTEYKSHIIIVPDKLEERDSLDTNKIVRISKILPPASLLITIIGIIISFLSQNFLFVPFFTLISCFVCIFSIELINEYKSKYKNPRKRKLITYSYILLNLLLALIGSYFAILLWFWLYW